MTYIADRLEQLRHGRAFYTWLGKIGVARDSVNRIKTKGEEPTDAVINALVKCENVSKNWLLYGEGTPYVIHQSGSDDDLADQILAYIEEEPWSVFILSDGFDRSIVLTLPCQYRTQRGKMIDYTAVEIFPEVDDICLSVANKMATSLYEVTISSEISKQLINGEIGTYQLIGDSENAVLKHAEPLTMQERHLRSNAEQLLTYANKIAEEFSSSTINSDEKVLLRNYQQLSDENKKLVQALTRNLR